jgi:hypothetical protein
MKRLVLSREEELLILRVREQREAELRVKTEGLDLDYSPNARARWASLGEILETDSTLASTWKIECADFELEDRLLESKVKRGTVKAHEPQFEYQVPKKPRPRSDVLLPHVCTDCRGIYSDLQSEVTKQKPTKLTKLTIHAIEAMWNVTRISKTLYENQGIRFRAPESIESRVSKNRYGTVLAYGQRYFVPKRFIEADIAFLRAEAKKAESKERYFNGAYFVVVDGMRVATGFAKCALHHCEKKVSDGIYCGVHKRWRESLRGSELLVNHANNESPKVEILIARECSYRWPISGRRCDYPMRSGDSYCEVHRRVETDKLSHELV